MFGKKNISDISDEQLMVLIAKDRKVAFEELYERYYKKLVGFAAHQTEEKARAEDIVQDVFIKIIEQPQAFNIDKRFSTWVYTLVQNACRNLRRNEANRSRILQQVLAGNDSMPTEKRHSNDSNLLAVRIQSVLNQASEKEQLVYALRFVQELSIKEISEIAEIPEGSVKSCIYYLLKKFEGRLKEFSDG